MDREELTPRKRENRVAKNASGFLVRLSAQEEWFPKRPSQWGTADAGSEEPSVENPELNGSPFLARRGPYIAMHATPTAKDFFFANFYLPVHSPAFIYLFIYFFAKPLLSFSCVGCGYH